MTKPYFVNYTAKFGNGDSETKSSPIDAEVGKYHNAQTIMQKIESAIAIKFYSSFSDVDIVVHSVYPLT